MLEERLRNFFGNYGLEEKVQGLDIFSEKLGVHLRSLEKTFERNSKEGLSLCWAKSKKVDGANVLKARLIGFYLSCLALEYQRHNRDGWLVKKVQTAVRIGKMISSEERERLFSGVINDFEREGKGWGYFSKGYFLYHQKKQEEALGYFRRAVEGGCDNPGLYYLMGRCYQIMGNYREKEKLWLAIQAYKEAEIKTKKKTPSLFYNLGGCYSRIGEHRKALDYFLKAEEIWEEGRPRVEQTKHLYSQISKCLRKLGDKEKGLLYLEKARECLPNDLGVRRSLMIGYSYMGDKEAAIRELDFCLKNKDNLKEVEKAIGVCMSLVKPVLRERLGEWGVLDCEKT